MLMKFDIPVPCFFGKDDFCDALQKIKNCGFDTVETYNWSELDAEKVSETLKKLDMKLISICTSDFRLTDIAFQTHWLESLKESIVAAKKLGAGMMITQVGQDTGESREIQHGNIVATLRLAAPILEEAGIILLVEPLNVLYNHKGYYLPSSAEAFEIIREVGSENIKVVFDIYHQQVTEGNIINNIRDNLPLIAHIHAAGHPGRNELQYGENDYKVIFNALEDMGYAGSVGLEYGPLLPPEESLSEFRRIYT